MAEIFTNAIKHHDRIVHRVTKDCKECRYKKQVNFCTKIFSKRDIDTSRNNHIVSERYDC